MTSRLPQPGSDDGTWGNILNNFLTVEHNSDGTHKSNAIPDASAVTKGKIKLAGDLIGTADTPIVSSMSGGLVTSTPQGDLNIPNLRGIQVGGSTILTKDTSTGTVIAGDTSGNARGAGAFDLQNSHTDPAMVASGPNTVAIGKDNTVSSTDSTYSGVAIGSGNTASGGGNPVAIGRSNVSSAWNCVAIGFGNTASTGNDSAVGFQNDALGGESSAFGRFNAATGWTSSAFGFQNSAIGSQSVAIGGRAMAIGDESLALGGTGGSGQNFASGARSSAVGLSIITSGNDSQAFGRTNKVGFTRRDFTVTAGGTILTLAGGNYTAEYTNGDTVVINLPTPGLGNSLHITTPPVNRTISAITYNAGANTTTFTISAAIDTTSTSGAVVSQSQGQRSTAIGYQSTVTASDAIAVGNNISNTVASSLMIGPSDTSKLTILATGKTGFGTTSPNSTLSVQGSLSLNRTPVSDINYTVTASDYVVAYASLTAARTVTLPTAVGITGRQYIIKDESGNAGTSNISVTGTGGQTIDGSATKSLTTPYGVLRLYSNGANWFSL